MARATIVYWRDIPAQVLVGRGRSAEKRELSRRFIAAIDQAAMRAGLTATDAYLAQWRRAEADASDGDPAAAADALAASLEAGYDDARLARISAAGGKDTP